MATRSAFAPAATPILSPVRTGLLRSVAPLLADRWQTGGVAYRPNTAFPGESFDDCTTSLSISADEESTVEWVAWDHALASGCLSLTRGEDGRAEEEARVLQRYNAEISHMVERVFWTGDLDDGSTFAGAGWPNRALADPASVDLTGVGPVGVLTAFNFAIEYLADTIGGVRGMIHVPAKLLPYLAFYGAAIRDGFNLLATLTDHLVVAGTGYDGSAPDGSPADAGTVWIYVTSIVRGAATEPLVVSDLDERGDNHWEAVATGVALAEWDLQAHAAIQVCITDPGPTCETGVS